jgi:hypothetical protein
MTDPSCKIAVQLAVVLAAPVVAALVISLAVAAVTRKRKPKQSTFIYCGCGNELCSSGSFISDTYDERGDNHVRYKCSTCGEETDYNFDIAPVPISWAEINKPSRPAPSAEKAQPTVDEALATVGECFNPDDPAEVVILAAEVRRLRNRAEKAEAAEKALREALGKIADLEDKTPYASDHSPGEKALKNCGNIARAALLAHEALHFQA